jgi:hypothetical protein
MFARIGVMLASNRASPVSLDVPRTESPFQKRAISFHEEQMGYPEKRDDQSPKKTHWRKRKLARVYGYGNRDSACAFEPTRCVAGGSVSFHARFTYIDVLT